LNIASIDSTFGCFPLTLRKSSSDFILLTC